MTNNDIHQRLLNARRAIDEALAPLEAHEPRQGSKEEKLIHMLKRPRGATLNEVINTFGMKKNSAYARISVVTRKHGLRVEHVGARYHVAA